jgi:hypothetical protein
LAKPKILKITLLLIMLSLAGGVIWYAQLSNRHKAIVKTTFLHKTGLVDSDWKIEKAN